LTLSNRQSSSSFFMSLILSIFSDDSRICCICLCLSFFFEDDQSFDLLMRVFAFSFDFFEWYAILKSNFARNSTHLACRLLSYFVIMKYFRTLWSVIIVMRFSIDCNFALHCSKHLIMISIFLS
jgi:hypothetical protein